VGDLVFAKASALGEAANIMAEAKAICEGLEYCVERQLHQLIMETDSLVIRKIIDGEWATPWCISVEVRKLKQIMNNYKILFQHVQREGNTIADFLANLAFSFVGTLTFQPFY